VSKVLKNFVLIILFPIVLNLAFFDLAYSKPIRAKKGMVVSANELATKVGVEILKNGGNAIDAAIGVGFTLAVTYPAAGNIGGGGFLVFVRNDGFATTIDYRETAPASAHRNMYLDSNLNPIPNMSLEGVTSAGVPGTVAGMLYALEKYGTMTLKEVIQPAIKLADTGFKLNHELSQSLNYNSQNFNKFPSSKKIFMNNGSKFVEGDIFIQKDLAETLKRIRDYGTDGFYRGITADLIVAQMKKDGGLITHEDLSNYKAVERMPVRGNYRGYEIVSMGPPSSGGIALIEALNVLENINFNKEEFQSSRHLHYLIETVKRVYFDRTEYLGDSDFVSVPVERLTSKKYARKIFNSIDLNSASSNKLINTKVFEKKESIETTHYSVYDYYGNAVSVTTTINGSFGSNVVVDGAGFLLNNEMDDFSIKPGFPNMYDLIGSDANSIQPNKRMLSSMTPTIILKDNKPVLIIGSPGGPMIITSVLQAVMNVIDFGMDIEQAVNMPRIHHQWLPEDIYFEQFALSKDVKEKLESIGHKFQPRNSIGRLEGIMIDNKNNIIYGVSDRRGSGSAEGF
jgi:gamma-glutamyltranspeptidase/glutathione hydrolase